MDSFEINKIVGAGLMALLIATVIGHAGDILVREPEGGSHIEIAGVETASAPAATAPAPAALQPIEPFLAKASIDDGKKVANQCKVCHTLGKGEPARIGPNLYGIVGEKVAARAGFQFSDALKKVSGDWSFDELNKWLAGPQQLAPGTKMTFVGIKDEQQRADVIAYLNSLSDAPQPLPK
ncbi:MAG TPA: cytochrome c family protein [Alphaproteobacteria bacterium]|nr:cytochrome c family protein [Alphaproteobacteria bacterium]